jgi:hypothetical protein
VVSRNYGDGVVVPARRAFAEPELLTCTQVRKRETPREADDKFLPVHWRDTEPGVLTGCGTATAARLARTSAATAGDHRTPVSTRMADAAMTPARPSLLRFVEAAGFVLVPVAVTIWRKAQCHSFRC